VRKSSLSLFDFAQGKFLRERDRVRGKIEVDVFEN